MIFDQDSLARQQELDQAFESGWHKGRAECDEHVMAECVALRVHLAQREAWECLAMNIFASLAVIGCWGLIGWLILR